MYDFVITAATLSGNKGAESMVTALYQNLIKLYPGSRVYLLSYYPEADRPLAEKLDRFTVLSGTPANLLLALTPLALLYRLLTALNLPVKILEQNPAIRVLAAARIVFDVGGITFSDGREVYLPFNIVTILPALLMNKPVFKCAQAIGPFQNLLNRWCAKTILPRVSRIFARGRATSKHLHALGLSNIVESADIAFTLKGEAIDTSRCARYFPQEGQNVFGISPSSVVYTQCLKAGIDYVGLMARFADHLVEQYEVQVLFIPHSARPHTERLKNNDLPIILRIMKQVANKSRCLAIEEELTASEQRAIIQRCRFFFASRFHSMISALVVGVPLLVCGWGHKYLETLEQFGLEAYAFDYADLSFDTLRANVERLVRHHDRICEKIDRALPDVQRLAFQHFIEAQSLIGNTDAVLSGKP